MENTLPKQTVGTTHVSDEKRGVYGAGPPRFCYNKHGMPHTSLITHKSNIVERFKRWHCFEDKTEEEKMSKEGERMRL